jgi:calcineurin-like phosphoesterase family protein
MCFFISDTHFFHKNIIRLAGRPFKDVTEMNETMIENWNKVVFPKDIVYHLGDFAYGTWSMPDSEKAIQTLFGRLNGVKHLIKGNHDHAETLDLPWASVSDYKTLTYYKKMIVLFHYPIIEWDGAYRGSYHFHGHTHQISPLEVMSEQVLLAEAAQEHFPDWEGSPKIEDSRFKNYYKNWRNVGAEIVNYTPQYIDELLKEKE